MKRRERLYLTSSADSDARLYNNYVHKVSTDVKSRLLNLVDLGLGAAFCKRSIKKLKNWSEDE